ncbi:hypothetical protein ACIRRA_39630 [Nocardia sp. NPDC101769]|uniref:hypothetical protein n=1 Tax=Nocardia sp. NPDC101769 TaxID=3364333 RepID=UPI003827723E
MSSADISPRPRTPRQIPDQLSHKEVQGDFVGFALRLLAGVSHPFGVQRFDVGGDDPGERQVVARVDPVLLTEPIRPKVSAVLRDIAIGRAEQLTQRPQPPIPQQRAVLGAHSLDPDL